jgi:uncharacterized protein (DUF924 family)
MIRDDSEHPWVDEVLEFWFEELREADWFTRNEVTDARIRERFLALYERLAQAGDLAVASARSALAAVIVLDQFSRNLFRGTARAFAADASARQLARQAIAQGFDQAMPPLQRLFLYLPFEHSEDPADQALSVTLIRRLGREDLTRYAEAHKAIIDRFGRYPHRNAALGRTSTTEELEFLQGPGSSF